MKADLSKIINELIEVNGANLRDVELIIRRYPKEKSKTYKRSEVLEIFEQNLSDGAINLTAKKMSEIRSLLKIKSTRTESGVTPVTVLTKPFPCPGKCIFCPNDVRMPKSYLSDEPGAQRAFRNKFDPYAQTYNRLIAYKNIGHPTDKIELIILGGTWTSYPEPYQIWFVKRCFDAMNEFSKDKSLKQIESGMDLPYMESLVEEILGAKMNKSYNQAVALAVSQGVYGIKQEFSSWENLYTTHRINENAETRCIGLVIETRPDEINEKEVIRIRKLGATKVQIGFQSLNDQVLKLNNRGHNVSVTRKAVKLLRQAGFKIHAHWMPNLYGSTPEKDVLDYEKMFKDKAFRPDEVKIYPCSLIASAELMQYYQKGLWKPYTLDELKYVLKEAYKLTPTYCRITRMIRDIGSQDIVTGNKTTNLREIVEAELKQEKANIQEIRFREIRGSKVTINNLKFKILNYKTTSSVEFFLQYVTKDNKIVGFLRLSIPIHANGAYISELKNSAIIREVHIYGTSIEIGEKSAGKAQHLGLGRKLIQKTEEIAKKRGFTKIAVISSIGTREYYKKLGYEIEGMYSTKKTPVIT